MTRSAASAIPNSSVLTHHASTRPSPPAAPPMPRAVRTDTPPLMSGASGRFTRSASRSATSFATFPAAPRHIPDSAAHQTSAGNDARPCARTPPMRTPAALSSRLRALTSASASAAQDLAIHLLVHRDDLRRREIRGALPGRERRRVVALLALEQEKRAL